MGQRGQHWEGLWQLFFFYAVSAQLMCCNLPWGDVGHSRPGGGRACQADLPCAISPWVCQSPVCCRSPPSPDGAMLLVML